MYAKISKSLLVLSLVSSLVFADTPAPGNVTIKGATDSTKIGNVSDSLKVNVTNSISATAVNASVGSNSSTAPASSTQIGGVDGSGNLQPVKLDASNRILVNGSQVTQPVSGNLGRTWSLLNSTDSVNVGNFPATQACTQSGSWNVGGTVNAVQSGTWGVNATQAGTWSTGRTWALSGGTDSVNVGNFPATQACTQSGAWSVSGTVTANQGGAWNVGRLWNLTSASDSVATTGIGNFTVVQPTGSNLHVVVDSGPTTLTANQGTSPWVVSGTVTSNIGTTGGLALDSTVSSIDSKLTTLGQKSNSNSVPVVISNNQSAIPVTQSGTWNIGSVSTIPLPTGAATSAKQDTGNSSLSSIVTSTSSTSSSLDVNLSTRATESTLSSLNGKFNSLGQKAMTASVPVVIASDQSNLNINGSVLVSNFPSTQAVTQSGIWNLSNITGTVSLPTGAATSAKQDTGNASLSSIVTSTSSTVTNQTNGSQTTRITDGTNTVAVKPAFTAPTTSDPAAVVAISPNSPINVTSVPPTNAHTVGTITASCATISSCPAGSTVQTDTNGFTTLGYGTTGTWNGLVTTDISYDPACSDTPNSVVWYNTASMNTLDSEATYILNFDQNDNNEPWVLNVASVHCARIRAITLTSGTIGVELSAGVGTAMVWNIDTGNIASGSTDFGNPVKTGGVYNATLPTLSNGSRGDTQIDSKGRAIIAPLTSSSVVSVGDITGTVSLPTNAAKETGGNLASIATNTSSTATNTSNLSSIATSTSSTATSTSSTATNTSSTVTNQTNGNQKSQRVDGSGNVAPAMDIASRAGFQKITDGTNVMSVKGASTAAGASDPSAVVAFSPNSPLPAGTNNLGNILNISGTVSLPTGAATSANQTTANTSLSSIATSTSSTVSNQTNGTQKSQAIDGSGNVVTIKSASSSSVAADTSLVIAMSPNSALPAGTNTLGSLNNISGTISLPTGAATSALQTTGNTSLSSIATSTSSIDGKLNSLGQKTMSASVPVTIASDQSPVPDVSSSGNITSTQNVQLTVAGNKGASVLVTGTWTGTLTFEASQDGSTWYTAEVFSPPASGTETTSSSTTTNGTFQYTGIAGIGFIRVRGNTVATGTAVVSLRGNQAAFNTPFFTRENGSSVPTYGVMNGVSDGTNLRFMAGDTSGRVTTSSNASYVNITTATTTTVKSGAGVLYAICHNTLVNNATVTVYDNTTAATPTIGKWTQVLGGGAAAPSGCQQYGGGMNFSTGLTIVTSGASDLTVIYK